MLFLQVWVIFSNLSLKSNWPLLFILLVAAIFRLYRIDVYMEFLGDQGRDVVIVRDFLRHGNLFFIGPQTSIGNMYLGPYYYYLIAPSLLLANFNPVGPAAFVALLGLATVYLVYHVGRQWFDQPTALIAAFLLAISPVAIKYSNFSWNPNIMPLFALLFIYLVWQKKYLLATPAFILAFNSHYLSLLLLPVAFIIWLKDRGFHHSLKTSILAIFLFLISLAPQVLFDLKHQGQNVRAISTFFTQRETTVNLKAYKAVPKLSPLHTQIVTRLVAAKEPRLGQFLSLIIGLGFVYLLFTRPKNFGPLALWYSLGLIGLGLYKQHLYDHYFGFLSPTIFMITALVLRRLKLLGLLLLLPITYFSLVNSPLRSPLIQLASVQNVVALVNRQSLNQPFNFALLAKQNYDPPYRYFFYQTNAPLFDLKDKLTDQLFVVCEPDGVDCQPINHPEWNIAAFGWAKIDRQWLVDNKIVYRLIHL